MKRAVFLFMIVLFGVSCGIGKRDLLVETVGLGALVFRMEKVDRIRSISLREYPDGKFMWKLIDLFEQSDDTQLITDTIVYGKYYPEISEVYGPLPLLENVEYLIDIDCGKFFYACIFVIENKIVRTLNN